MVEFSVIVPVFNVEKYISRCIESILKQSVVNFELIIVDDGSTDSTYRICKDFEKIDKRIILLKQKNAGVSSARNEGIIVSQGKYIVFIDSDDAVSNKYLEDLNVEQYDLVVNDLLEIKELSELNSKTNEILSYTYAVDNLNEGINKNFINGNFNYAVAKRFKRNIIVDNKILFNNSINLSEDTLFVMEYVKHIQNLYISNDKNYFYFRNNNSLSSVNDIEELLNKLKKANELIQKEIFVLNKKDVEKIVAARLSGLYKQILYQIINDKKFHNITILKQLYEHVWFKIFLKTNNFDEENYKFKLILKSRNVYVLYFYLKFLYK